MSPFMKGQSGNPKGRKPIAEGGNLTDYTEQESI